MEFFNKQTIEEMRFNLGEFLYTYYVKFGEEKYEKFLEKLSSSMTKDYGEPFSYDNLRIMEAEYVTLKKLKNEKRKVSKPRLKL